MSQSDVIVEVSRRNAVSVMETLNRQDVKIQEQQKRIDALNEAFSVLTQRQGALEQANAMLRASSIGRGPTVR